MDIRTGGCLCGALRYETEGDPLRVWVCHCRFCQRATGGPYMVEPTFMKEKLRVTRGEPAIFDHRSAGSGRLVHVHFCAACGTKLFLTFERFPHGVGIYAGTYDDPGWIRVEPGSAKQIFISARRPDSRLMAGIPAFADHAAALDGTPLEPIDPRDLPAG